MKLVGTGEPAQRQQHRLLVQATLVQLPVPTGQFPTTRNFSSGVSNALTQTYSQAQHQCTANKK